MVREKKPFRVVVRDDDTLAALLKLQGCVNAAEFRGWPAETMTLLSQGRRFGERVWIITLIPIARSPWLRYRTGDSIEVSSLRCSEAADFSFVDRLETAIDFAGRRR